MSAKTISIVMIGGLVLATIVAAVMVLSQPSQLPAAEPTQTVVEVPGCTVYAFFDSRFHYRLVAVADSGRFCSIGS